MTSVEVYCAAPSHPTKRAVVARFTDDPRPGAGWWRVGDSDWHEVAATSVAARREAAAARATPPAPDASAVDRILHGAVGADVPTVRQTLVDDDPVAGAAEATARGERDRIRDRYALLCPLCGLDVQITGDRLAGLLDGLRTAGVAEVSLAGLAATL